MSEHLVDQIYEAAFVPELRPCVKLGASYRLDALINLQNQDPAAVANIMPDRYTHGPRLTVTGQF